ncbi:proline-rich receptor-like protein kinase PERK9 [Tanacetum coccineum]
MYDLYVEMKQNTEELTQTLWSTTMELEATKIKVQQDMKQLQLSHCEESIVSSPPAPQKFEIPAKGLPENGKFLEAVMKAGPLLNNLLLAGQLPHWRHPPPPLDCHQIPLVVPPPSGELCTKLW